MLEPNQRWKRHVFMALLGLCWSCGKPKDGPLQALMLQGNTMGTTYKITLITSESADRSDIQEQVQSVLDEIDEAMSNWIETSDVSRLNHAPQGVAVSISESTARVLARSLEVNQLTHGAFDITMSPLIEVWGFGTHQLDQFPSPTEIAHRLELTGPDMITLSGNTASKRLEDVNVNLSAIAKGFAVDRVHQTLLELGYNQHLIEVGGEVATSGSNAKGLPWRLGLEAPDPESRTPRLHQVIRVSGVAVATSGNYRNYFTYNGKLYSHIIDPRTGYPVEPTIASVSIVASDCMTADALATACMVLGVQDSLDLVERIDGVECVLVEEQDGQQRTHMSSGMGEYL